MDEARRPRKGDRVRHVDSGEHGFVKEVLTADSVLVRWDDGAEEHFSPCWLERM